MKVRNDFGNVSVEHWDQSYVTVEATIDGAATLTRSPILIDNRGTLVTISVVRRPIDPVVAIHLKLKIPATVEITSWDGKAYVKPSIQTSTEVAPQLVGAGNAKARPQVRPTTNLRTSKSARAISFASIRNW